MLTSANDAALIKCYVINYWPRFRTCLNFQETFCISHTWTKQADVTVTFAQNLFYQVKRFIGHNTDHATCK